MSKEETLSSSTTPQLDQNHHGPGPAQVPTNRSNRPSRACTIRAAARMAQKHQEVVERKQKKQFQQRKEEPRPEESSEFKDQCGENGSSGRVVTQLVGPLEPAQLPRWTIRSMWELASVFNFLNVFRDHLNVQVEFSAEELETALLMPNDNLGDVHIPLLKAIPPVTRMALTRKTWITVLCRKLRDWWHWVADGELPLVASHGMEVEVYKTLDPGIRVVILKALCDIRVEQEDIRNFIDDSLKHGTQLSLFRKERIGGDSQGIHYWYEDDQVIGQRLYREIRKVEMKRAKIKGSHVLPCTTYQWETVATNFEEFQDVSEKLFTSKNRTEVSLGKKLKNDMLPEIEKVQKRKERLLKKQHRQALLLDSYVTMDGLATGRSLRDRKPVTYTFDEYDRSISEAIKETKKKPLSPESLYRRDGVPKLEVSENGKLSGLSHSSNDGALNMASPDSPDYDDFDEEPKPDLLNRSNRRRQRPQRYAVQDFVEVISDNDADYNSDDDIVGEAVYNEDHLRKRKRRKSSSSSEGEEEYEWDDENGEEEEEDDEEDSLSFSEESDEPQKFWKLPGRTRRETKLRSVDEDQSGLRRSKRAMRNQINYRQYELSDSEAESTKPEKANDISDEPSDASENAEYLLENEDSDVNDNEPEMKVDQPAEAYTMTVEGNVNRPPEKSSSPDQDEVEGVRTRRFLDLNELAPGSGFDDGPNPEMKGDSTDDF